MDITRLIPGLLIALAVAPQATVAQEEESLIEEVHVTHTEVPVRVFKGSRPVENLQRGNFRIFSAGKERPIQGFFVKRKKIRLELPEDTAAESEYPPRYMALVFRIREVNDELKKGLRYAFDHILRPSDQLLVMTSTRVLFYPVLDRREETYQEVMGALETQGRESRERLRGLAMKIRNIEAVGTEPDELAENYLKIYSGILADYRQTHLQPALDALFLFAKYLETVKVEKWVLNFYQEEVFPHLGQSVKDWINSIIDAQMISDGHQRHDARIIHRRLNRLEIDLNAARNFPVDLLQKMFLRSDATFHTILIPTVTPPSFRFRDGDLEWEFEYKRISTDFENSLRDITRSTGGRLLASGDLESSLKQIEEVEDICYWLTFVPQAPNHRGKIRVEVDRPGCQLIYDDHIKSFYYDEFLARRNKGTRGIRLDEVTFTDRRLGIRIAGFYMPDTPEKSPARIHLRIRVKDQTHVDVYDQQKTLMPSNPTVRISIPMMELHRGKFSVLVDVKDLQTGRTAFRLLETRVM